MAALKLCENAETFDYVPKHPKSDEIELGEIEGLPYRVKSVIDYFTGQKVASVLNSSFKVTLPGYGTAVYCLLKGEK